MLVLTVKQGEFLRIGENIDVVIDRFKGNAVVVGIEAPRDVNVLRGKLVPPDEECGEGSDRKSPERLNWEARDGK